MGTVFSIAWRNVLRNKARSFITMGSIAIGIVALLLLWALTDGSYNNAIDNFRLRYVGSIQVHADGFFRRPKLETHIENPEAVVALLEEIGVDAWTTRLSSFALVAGEETSTGMSFIGVDPVREPEVSILEENLAAGRFLQPGDTQAAVLGKRAADKLNLALGDDVVMLTTDRMGAMTAGRFEVVGLLRTGDPSVDEASLFVPIADAQYLLAMEGRVTDVVAQVPERELEATAAALRAALDGQNMEVLRWFDISGLVLEAKSLDMAFAYIFLGIVLAIVVSGIANAVLVSMMQRTREFGVLLAVGTQRAAVGAMIAVETMVIGFAGVAAGTGLGLALVQWLNRIGVDYSAMAPEGTLDEMLAEFAMDPVVYPVVNTDHLWLTIVLMLLAALLSAIYPVWQAMRLEPIEAIRHV
jgi:putative ABC transport system permease protein